MKIEIYEPQQFIFPGVTEVKAHSKRTINVKSISRIGDHYVVLLDESEVKRTTDFIRSKSNGSDTFIIYFSNDDKWIKSRDIEAERETLWFSIYEENFKMLVGNCLEV